MWAWNFLVSHWQRYAASFRELERDGKDALARYRAGEIARLLEERGRIREFEHGLANQVLEHVEVREDGRLAVIFLTGTQVTV